MDSGAKARSLKNRVCSCLRAYTWIGFPVDTHKNYFSHKLKGLHTTNPTIFISFYELFK